jgi:hypothetical protein
MVSYIDFGVGKTITPSLVYENLVNIIRSLTCCYKSEKDFEDFIYLTNSKRIRLEITAPAIELQSDLSLLSVYYRDKDALSIANKQVCELLIAERSYKSRDFKNISDLIYNLRTAYSSSRTASLKVAYTKLQDNDITIYLPATMKTFEDDVFKSALKIQMSDMINNTDNFIESLTTLTVNVDKIRNNVSRMLSLNNLHFNHVNLSVDENRDIQKIKGLYKMWKPLIAKHIRRELSKGRRSDTKHIFER